MDFADLIESVSKLGLGAVVFVIWYFDNKKIQGLQDIVKEQVEDKKVMREERNKLIQIVEDSAKLVQKATDVMVKLEQRL